VRDQAHIATEPYQKHADQKPTNPHIYLQKKKKKREKINKTHQTLRAGQPGLKQIFTSLSPSLSLSFSLSVSQILEDIRLVSLFSL
jgi:hypothetical protein